ncbi:MAG: toxin-antitoxin system HicB family antitoxin [Pirellulaceae bacterium]
MNNNPMVAGGTNSSTMPGAMTSNEDFPTRCQKVLAVAKQLHLGNPDWVTFFREVLGVDGAARSVFASQQEFIAFEKSPEFAEIQTLVSNLRNRKISPNAINEPTRVITVRLPESLHEALKAEANDHNTSMNKLCISKLLQVLSDGPKINMAASRSSSAPSSSASQPAGTTNFRSTYQPAQSGGAGSNSTGGFRYS